MENLVVPNLTDAHMRALNDRMANYNASHPGQHISTREAFIRDVLIGDLVRAREESENARKAFEEVWTKSSYEERLKMIRQALTGISVG